MPTLRPKRSTVALRLGIAGVVSIAVWFWPVGTPHVPPSFDCARATLPTEKAICSDPELARIDTDFAQYYEDSRQAVAIDQDTVTMARLEKGQRDFIERRNQCGAVKWCIERTYAQRDRQLAELVGAPRRPAAARAPDRGTGHLGPYLIGELERARRR